MSALMAFLCMKPKRLLVDLKLFNVLKKQLYTLSLGTQQLKSYRPNKLLLKVKLSRCNQATYMTV